MSSPSHPHRARKRFGQNFLHDDSVIDRIAASIAVQPDDHVVEIGPGQGALTGALVTAAGKMDVIELDRDLVPLLLASFSIHNHFTLHSADALTFDFAALAQDGRKLRVVGNLPYNISTPLIFALLQQRDVILDMHFMLQLEVVERLAAAPGSKAWGRLGAMTQFHCRVEHLFDVPPEAFRPAPRVQSAIVRLTPWEESPWPACDEAKLAALLQAAFAQRRKTLRNNLKGLIDNAGLEAIGIDPSVRAETLALPELIRIANAINV
jgi:16S rRNA (adenine1518-N6/adenine1519-N6)-dimethyltransferase